MRDQRAVETADRTRKALYIVIALYVVIGLLLALPSAVASDRMSVFSAFLVIATALGFALVLAFALRLSVRMCAVAECLDDMRRRLERVERLGEASDTESPDYDKDATRMLDLAAIGSGDPSTLAAATLERARYPRLATALDEVLLAACAEPENAGPAERAREARAPAGAIPADTEVDRCGASGFAEKNPLRTWKVALRNGDLATCREVLSMLLDTAAPDLVAELSEQLDALTARRERSLRAAFTGRLRDRDYAGAILVGKEIRRLFPDRRIARDFERVAPYLRQRLARQEHREVRPPALVPKDAS